MVRLGQSGQLSTSASRRYWPDFEKIVAAKALCVRQRKCKLTRMNAACHATLHAGSSADHL